jgi:hypothetical protein
MKRTQTGRQKSRGVACMSSEEYDLLKEIARKLDILIGFAATVGRDDDAQIDVLTSLGYGPAFIGPVVGLKPHAVSVRLSRRKKTTNRSRSK